MENSIYNSPNSDLDDTREKPLTAAEKLAQSRKDMEESSSAEKLNMVWGFRLIVDLMFVLAGLFASYNLYTEGNYEELWGTIIVVVFFGAEIVAIVGYFRRKSWCVIPLHIFSGISLLTIPFGTILSIIHFLNMSKIQFNKNV